jgi:hypothetical protein
MMAGAGSAASAAVVAASVYCDPGSVWSWGLVPVLRRLSLLYGTRLSIKVRIVGPLEDGRSADPGSADRLRPRGRGDLRAAVGTTGQPVDLEAVSRLTDVDLVPVRLAAVAALTIDPLRGPRFVRRLMEYLQVRGLAGDLRTIAAAARDVGVDPRRLETALGTDRSRAALATATIEMARSGATVRDVAYDLPGAVRTMVRNEFRSLPHESAIDRLAPGRANAARPTVDRCFEPAGDLVSVREAAEVAQVADAVAAAELEGLWRKGVVERWTYGGAPFWTATRPGVTPGPS